MEILEFTNNEINKDEIILKFLNLHNQPENLKMLSFTGIEFGINFFKELIESKDDNGIKQFYLKDNDNNICGFIVIKENIMYGFELLSIVIDPNYRNMGYANKLIIFACEYAKNKSYLSTYTSVFADNKKMLILLLKLDFIPVNIQHHSRYDGVDLVFLQKRLL